jgi:diguanylate cyclase (GGDEF)-like protein
VTRRPSAFSVFVGVVILAGTAVLATALVLRLPAALGSLDARFALLALLLVAAELRPINVHRDGSRDAVSLSAAFAVALLLGYDWSLVLVVQAVASAADDARHRTAWWTSAFNISQYTLALAGAGLLVDVVGGSELAAGVSTAQLPLVLGVCLVFFLLNTLLPGIAYALQADEPVLRSLREDLPFQASVNGVVVLMGPLVVAAADDSLWLVGLLLVPTYAVYRGALAALDRAHLSTHDTLTGLPNQSTFLLRLGDMLDEPDGHVGLLVLNLDHFSDVNHTLGRDAAEDLLRQVAARLTAAAPSDAAVARSDDGGFLVAVPALESPFQASSCAELLLRQFSDPYSLAESAFALRASIGLTISPLHGTSAPQLVQHAQVAGELARRSRSGLEVYSAERDEFTARRLTVLRGLGPGLRRHEMAVHFQPQVDLTTLQVTGYEALLRWDHPDLGRIPPDEFVALAEHAGMMQEITDFVLDESLRQLAGWREQGVQVTVSVNVSASVLQDEALPAKVARGLAVWGVPSSALVIELTETAVMSDPERCQRVMAELRRLHVGLSLDDYGTGWASLSYLTTLPVDEIKIDKSFVLAMSDSSTDRAVVRSTLDLARELGLRVVAEGVETGELAALLQEYGCRTAQGYHYGRPVPPRELVLDLTGVGPRP